MINYNKFWKICEKKNIRVTDLINAGLHRDTVYKMRRNEGITTAAIDKACALLHVQPGALLEWQPDAEPVPDQQEPNEK